jgi:hypothetical protein
VNHNDGPGFDNKMLFEMVTSSSNWDTGAKKKYGTGDGQNAALNVLKTHVS